MMVSAAGVTDMAKLAVKRTRQRVVVVRKRTVRDHFGVSSPAGLGGGVVGVAEADVDCTPLPANLFSTPIEPVRGL